MVKCFRVKGFVTEEVDTEDNIRYNNSGRIIRIWAFVRLEKF